MKKLTGLLLCLLMMISLSGCSSTGTTVKDEKEWAKMFEQLSNVTVSYTDGNETVVLKSDGTNCMEELTGYNPDYYVGTETGLNMLSNKGDGVYEDTGYNLDITADRFIVEWMGIGGYAEYYEDFTYDEELKAYVFETDYYKEELYVENGKIVKLVAISGDLTITGTFTDYGKTTVTLPEYYKANKEVSNEEFEKALNSLENVTVYLFETVDEDPNYLVFMFDGQEANISAYFGYSGEYFDEYVRNEDGKIVSYYVGKEEEVVKTEVTSGYVDEMRKQIIVYIPENFEDFTYDETNECYIYETEDRIHTLKFLDGKLASYVANGENYTLQIEFERYGETKLTNDLFE